MDFERLSHQHKDAVYRQMVRVCGNREDAEDVLIEALLKAYRSLGDLAAPEAFRAWLAALPTGFAGNCGSVKRSPRCCSFPFLKKAAANWSIGRLRSRSKPEPRR